MPCWGAFAQAQPKLAQFGISCLHAQVAYLATVNARGLPRVHPVDAHHRCRSAVGVYEGNFAQRGPISSEVVAMPCILASPIGTAPTESFLLRALVVSLRSPPSVRKQPGALPTIHVTITFFSNSLLNGFSRFCTPRRVPNARSGVCPESARLGYPSSRDRCVVKRRDQPSYR